MTDSESTAPPVVVELPCCIDVANSIDVYAQLITAFTEGAPVVVADLTTTSFCDTSGIRQIELARQGADELGVDFRVVVPAGIVLRVLQILRLDQVWALYPTLEAALQQQAAPVRAPGCD